MFERAKIGRSHPNSLWCLCPLIIVLVKSELGEDIDSSCKGLAGPSKCLERIRLSLSRAADHIALDGTEEPQDFRVRASVKIFLD